MPQDSPNNSTDVTIRATELSVSWFVMARMLTTSATSDPTIAHPIITEQVQNIDSERCLLHHADSITFSTARFGPGSSLLAKYSSSATSRFARFFTEPEQRAIRSDISRFEISQPNE